MMQAPSVVREYAMVGEDDSFLAAKYCSPLRHVAALGIALARGVREHQSL
jgi:hypothetical protein